MQLQSLSKLPAARDHAITETRGRPLHRSAPLEDGALIPAQPLPTCMVSVVIPARDEAESIERTLTSLAHQRRLTGQPLPHDSYEIILLANNCRDATAGVARQLARRFPGLPLHIVEMDLPTAVAHVGAARRLGMDEARSRLFSVQRPRGVIATTDADTVVTPTWIAATLHEVAQGAEAVGGRILVAAPERQAMTPSVRSRFLRNVGYGALINEVAARVDPQPGDPWPHHEQFSGASIAVTARAYQRTGGLPMLPSGEDTALARALQRADIPIRHSPAVRVATSARLEGRTPAGLAASLASWADLAPDGQLQLVPDTQTVIAQATCRRALRDLWGRTRDTRDFCPSELARLAEFADVPETWLRHAVLDAVYLGQVVQAVEGQSRWWQAPQLVDVRVAIAGLRAWLEPYRRADAAPPAFARHVGGFPFMQPPPKPARSRPVEAVPSAASALMPLEEIEAVSRLTSPSQVA